MFGLFQRYLSVVSHQDDSHILVFGNVTYQDKDYFKARVELSKEDTYILLELFETPNDWIEDISKLKLYKITLEMLPEIIISKDCY